MQRPVRIRRDRRLVLFFGAPGQGKTRLARLMVCAEERKGQRVIVLDPSNGKDWPQGEWVPRANVDGKLLIPWINNITNHGDGPAQGTFVDEKGALLVLDDADTYITNTNVNNAWKPVWTRNRHLCLDVILISHRPQGIPKEAINSAKRIFIFAMGEVYGLEYIEELLRGDGFLKPGQSLPMPHLPGQALVVTFRPTSVQMIQFFDIDGEDRRAAEHEARNGR